VIGHRRPYPHDNEAAQILTLEVFGLEYRLVKLADQIEKLSWMLEYIERQTINGIQQGYGGVVYVESAERAWKALRMT
jgi:hypothetical protein